MKENIYTCMFSDYQIGVSEGASIESEFFETCRQSRQSLLILLLANVVIIIKGL